MTTPQRRKRPKDRREQIARAAAEDFGRRGYHGVGIEDIAAALNISGPAVYRHFSNKYALLEHAITTLSNALTAGVADAIAGAADAAPAARLDAALAAAFDVSVQRRDTGGLFRWEQRILEADDRARIRRQLGVMVGQVADVAAELYPQMPRAELELRTVAALSVPGSVTAHRTVLAQRRAGAVLLAAARAVFDPQPVPVGLYHIAAPEDPRPEQDRAEELLDAAIELFFAHGYHSVSMGQIGTAAGIVQSGVYRYFPSKAAMLVGVLESVGAETIAAIDEAQAAGRTDPRDVLDRMCAAYVELSFRRSKVMTVYFREIGNVPDSDRRRLAGLQRGNIGRCADAVVAARPELSRAEAVYLVHAAFAVVFDVGRTCRFDPDPAFQEFVYGLVRQILLGPAA
ncbi:TetR/AcrR family transcriptional regulator [Tsukamurella sp. 8F]|uniref:TetR/AcrR family transcriptional regulator n=1 Tax=unclassified Tsukamurella TaxID=2633480 RepID=UPI0023BA112A|nr:MULTISPECIES: TetR/AcrR family transcriptional regulator [unclassified Tsukamurella]MDF0531560.1 TetR/AcrR family transcriptional regulator [Tsukamurella sp. 8J]MDF0588828.1 TetR/AcrR family transcriptional regulator [Tsukamurella sp. 8F]